MEKNSKLYTSYRALGLVSNSVPLKVRYIKRRKEFFVVTVIGNAFHTYEENGLRLHNVGNPHNNPISCLATDTYHVYTATDNTIFAWRRTTELIHSYTGHADKVELIVPFGPHIISVDRKNILYIWDIKTEELHLQVEFPDTFQITCLMHPETYINKILLGSRKGQLQLWNIRTSKLIYTFSGWNSEVNVLEQAPAQDVVAIGLNDGGIHLHNLKYDETIVSFKQEWGPVTALSFRTDNIPLLVSGSTPGHIAVWDLKERKLSSQLLNAHNKSVTGLKCLSGEPKMVSSSPDNTLKVWIFDMPDGGARMLHFRDGHCKPPNMIRFHGSLGENLISASGDSTLRVFSTVNDMLSKNFGFATFTSAKNKKSRLKFKMPPVVAFTSETTQEKPWDNIACIHKGVSMVTTWSFEKQRVGEHKLKHKRFSTPTLKRTMASCLNLSACGNYVIIGYNSGHLDKYNIQSGIFKGTFIDSEEVAHNESISGVASDFLNQVVISGDYSGFLKWWRFKLQSKMWELKFDAGISALNLQRESGLIALIMENFSLQIVDIDTRNIVRKLFGHSNQITDIAFSPNSKWLISSSLDKSIRTWDLPSSSCIDHFCTPVPASSISISPTGEFLASTHAGYLGVYLWANRACFQHISLSALPENFVPPCIDLPSVGIDESHMVVKEGEVSNEEYDAIEIDFDYESPEQISKDLVTLSLLPLSRWLNLLHLDTIKKRNKPKEPLIVPKVAPFFIPTIPGLNPKFDENISNENTTSSKLKCVSSFMSLTLFAEKIKEKDYENALKLLIEMSPTRIDIEIRKLDPITVGSDELLLNFLKMIKYALSQKNYFEAVQGYLGLFLKIYSDIIIDNEEAQEICHKLLNHQKDTWYSLKHSLNQSLSLISYFKNSAIINY